MNGEHVDEASALELVVEVADAEGTNSVNNHTFDTMTSTTCNSRTPGADERDGEVANAILAVAAEAALDAQTQMEVVDDGGYRYPEHEQHRHEHEHNSNYSGSSCSESVSGDSGSCCSVSEYEDDARMEQLQFERRQSLQQHQRQQDAIDEEPHMEQFERLIADTRAWRQWLF